MADRNLINYNGRPESKGVADWKNIPTESPTLRAMHERYPRRGLEDRNREAEEQQNRLEFALWLKEHGRIS